MRIVELNLDNIVEEVLDMAVANDRDMEVGAKLVAKHHGVLPEDIELAHKLGVRTNNIKSIVVEVTE